MNGDARIGAEVAGYRIEAVLGRGGMSVVYLAEDVRLRRKVALKLLSPELSADERFRDRFVRESQIAAGLDHPNIIPIYEAGEADGALFIAMRYVRGTDLKTLLRNEGPLPPDRTVEILTAVAGALDEAHAEGLVHRDVKPANVLIASGRGPESSGQVYLSDFGVTKRTSSDSGITSTGQFVGTLDYAAPEQVTGAPLDGRTDVYSLGCVLYECLTGEPPFVRDAEMAVLWAHVNQPPPKVTEKRPELPPDIDAVVAKAMAKSPDDRYATCAEQASAARSALRVPTDEHPKAFLPARPGVRRGTVLAVSGALVALAAVIFAVFILRGGKTASAPPSAAPRATDSVWRIDPTTGKVLAKIPTGEDPRSVAVGEGSVWIANFGSDTVTRVDPVTNRTIDIRVGREPVDLAVGEGAVWVVTVLDRSISRVDTASNRVVAKVSLGGRPNSVAVDGEGVWAGVSDLPPNVSRFGTAVVRIDPATNTSTALIPVQGQFRNFVAAEDGAVWVATDSGVLSRIDEATEKVADELALESVASGVAVGGGSVWVTSESFPGTVARVDVSEGRVIATIPVGGTNIVRSGVAVGDNKVWVTDSVNEVVSAILIVSNDVSPTRIRTTGPPSDLALGGDALWVTIDSSFSG
jgi:streptogramin lyase